MLKKIIKRVLLTCAFVALIGVTAIVGIVLWDMPPRSEREYASIRHEWDQASASKRPSDERIAQERQFLDRCLQLAAKYPDTAAGLAALMLADARAQDPRERETVSEKLRSRIATAEFKHLVRTSGYGIPCLMSSDVAAPEFYSRVKQHLDHPMAPLVLASVSGILGGGSEAKEPPPLFLEIADLIVSRFVESQYISSFCMVLGNGTFSPPWADQFERHVNRILESNHDRLVRCAASLALAEIAHASPDRQAEAERKYRALLEEFDGHTKYHGQGIEQLCRHNATQRLESMQFAPIGKPAPEIVGLDLDGKPMALSEYRGKVALVTFWATWCGPCMKLVSHERELAEQYAGQPFAIVGVNADDDLARANDAVARKSITWRSFRDKREGTNAISDEWSALFPTVYLIDHHGIVRQRLCGNSTPDLLKQSVAELVAAATAKTPGSPPIDLTSGAVP